MVNQTSSQIPNRKVPPLLVITGVTGFIGTRVKRFWHKLGWPITSDKALPRKLNQDVHLLHLAGVIAGPRKQVIAENLRLTTEALGLAKKLQAKQIIFASSIKVLGERQTAYARAKKMCETLIEGSGLPYTILRLGQVYGPGDHKNFTSLLGWIKWLRVAVIPGNGQFRLQPIHVDDVAKLVAAIVKQPVGENQKLTVVGPERLTWVKIINRLGKMLKQKLWRVRLPAIIFKPEMWQSLFDNEVFAGNVDWQKLRIKLNKFPIGIEDI